MRLGLVLITILTMLASIGAYAASEIDQEIDRLTTEMRPSGHFYSHTKNSNKYLSRKIKNNNRGIRVAGYRQQVVPAIESGAAMKIKSAPTYAPATAPAYVPDQQPLGESYSASPPLVDEIKSPRIRGTTTSNVSTIDPKTGSSLFYRFSVLPQVAFATFDGSGSDTVIPHGVSNPYISSPSGSILTDINFGSNYFVAETGVSYLRAGSYTADQIPLSGIQAAPGIASYIYSEQVTLHYIGVPINLKWMISGESRSSFYIKVGATPSLLIKSEYSNLVGPGYLGYRFGTFNSFDLIGNAAVGVDFSVYKNFGIVVEGGYYHGIFAVSPNYDIFNTGFTVGLGVTYVL